MGRRLVKAVLENLRQLGLPRLAALGGVGVAMLLLLGVLVMHGASSADSLLYRDLDAHEAGEIVEQLTKSHISYSLKDQGNTILVSEADVARARLLLAKSGLPSGGSVGYEIFDKANGFTATQFEQTINETRAMEGELERSIRLINGVQNARVHLVLRHRKLFSTDEQGAQASVLLSMRGGRRLDAESVSAIVNLVSAAVPGLEARNISLIDNHGHVLLKEGAGMAGGESLEEQRQALEQRVARSVEDILGSSVGVGHIRVEANVAMNNDHVRETQERYDPDQQVLRSQQTKSEKSINTQGNTSTTVTNNLPNANAGQAQNGSQSTRQEQTDNYEIGKTVRTVLQDQPKIARLSVAVMVDGITQVDNKGKATWAPRDAQELVRLTDLTKSAIGFDQSRGDVVTVMSMKFVDVIEATPADEAKIFGIKFSHSDEMQAARLGLFSLCLLLVLFFVVRPLMKPPSDRETSKLLEKNNGVLDNNSDQFPSISRPVINSPDALLPVSYQGDNALVLSEPETVHVNGVEGRIKASSVQKVMELVEMHPSESIAMMRGWMMPEQGVH
nr:flagellar basal-body MS-ring/collar protein FliF [Gluconobacter wancherniae]